MPAFIIVLFLSVINCAFATATIPPTKSFRVNAYRTVGRTQTYVFVCFEDTTRGSTAIGRAETQAPQNPGQDRGVFGCLLKGRNALVHDCSQGRSQFERAAGHLLQSCASASPLQKDENTPDARDFDKDNCEASFVSYVGGESGGIWVCECLQPQFSLPSGGFWVVSGRAIFSTEFAPGGAVEEVNALKDCTADVQEQLREVCNSSPGDFELLALHLLQTCCKRARKASDAKFQCAAAVPDDVAFLKFVSFVGN